MPLYSPVPQVEEQAEKLPAVHWYSEGCRELSWQIVGNKKVCAHSKSVTMKVE